jgi:hypothetical protein
MMGVSGRMPSRQTTDWTHPSVRRFAGTADPIELVADRARTTVRDAIQAGWEGPPFDPSVLAKILRIPTIPTEDVVEARTVSSGSQVRIEFNPNRPPARIRFSIAHELAHTLFPDFHVATRNRGAQPAGRSDDWQLELLCNLAASEFLMPTSCDIDPRALVDIDFLLRMQSKFDISMEAVALRLAHSSLFPFTVVVASRISDSPDRPIFRVDYSVPARNSTLEFERGSKLENPVFSQCVAVGFTAKGIARDLGGSSRVAFECVGVPPYPGSVYPRVVGLARVVGTKSRNAKSITSVFGDALIPREAGPNFIAQIVNDKTPTWGAGFSRTVREKFPSAQQDFRDWCSQSRRNLTLGNLRIASVGETLSIASLVAQHGYGPADAPRIRYSALEQCLEKLGEAARGVSASVQMPRIGTGYGGGNWAFILELIDQHLVRKGVQVTIVALPGSPETSPPSRVRSTQLTLVE